MSRLFLATVSLIMLFIIWVAIPYFSGIEWMSLSPLFLLVGCFIVCLFHAKTDSRFLAYALSVYLSSFALCAVGAASGMLFGQYFYGNNLGVLVFDTPLIIGIYWLLLCYTSSALVSQLAAKIPRFQPTAVKVLLASMLVLLADMLIEPIASSIDFWYWKNQQAPLQNYSAWFVFAVAFNFLFQQLEIDSSNKMAPRFFVLWIIFLIALNLLS